MSVDIYVHVYGHMCMHIHNKLTFAADQFDCPLPRLTTMAIENSMEINPLSGPVI